MSPLPVSPFATSAFASAGLYIVALTILCVVLVVRIIFTRYALRVGIGDGGHAVLARRIRAHGNLIEMAPFLFALLLLLAALNASVIFIHIVGLCALVGRIAHALAISGNDGASSGRGLGMGLTFTALAVGSFGVAQSALVILLA